MKHYTIQQFRKQYPNDAICLDRIFQLRYGNLEACPNCGVVHAEFKRITTRRAYQCRECYYQIYPTAGTIFEKSTTPLVYWFYAMYLMTVTTKLPTYLNKYNHLTNEDEIRKAAQIDIDNIYDILNKGLSIPVSKIQNMLNSNIEIIDSAKEER